MEPKNQLESAFAMSGTSLDEHLQVVVDGEVVCCLAFTATFYLDQRDQAGTRARVAESFDRYRVATDNSLVWARNPRNRKFTKLVRNERLLDLRAWFPRLGPNDSLVTEFHGGRQRGDASQCMFTSVTNPVSTPDLGYVTLALPLSWEQAKPQGAFVRFILSQCEALRPEHAHAGLGIVLAPGTRQTSEAMQYAASLAQRFRGLDLSHAWWHAVELGKLKRIKGTGWLTAISTSWVAQLGGRSALADTLGKEILVYDYAGGVLIEAGPQPQVGDVQSAEQMPNHERLAKALRTIRATRITALAPLHGLDEERTAEWLARFDR